jgi:hypothetical protein
VDGSRGSISLSKAWEQESGRDMVEKVENEVGRLSVWCSRAEDDCGAISAWSRLAVTYLKRSTGCSDDVQHRHSLGQGSGDPTGSLSVTFPTPTSSSFRGTR